MWRVLIIESGNAVLRGADRHGVVRGDIVVVNMATGGAVGGAVLGRAAAVCRHGSVSC